MQRPFLASCATATNLSSSAELEQRLEREARTISCLNHPHICQLYDVGSHDGSEYLVMEFLEGETLASRLRRGAMPFPEILKVGIAVAEALAVAHRQGIVHRDLKLGNIMLTSGGAKLMDFGLAKPFGMPAAASGAGAPLSFAAAATLSGPSPLSPLTTAGSSFDPAHEHAGTAHITETAGAFSHSGHRTAAQLILRAQQAQDHRSEWRFYAGRGGRVTARSKVSDDSVPIEVTITWRIRCGGDCRRNRSTIQEPATPGTAAR